MSKRRPSKAERQRRVACIGVFAVAFCLVAVTLDRPGIAWDEPSSVFPGWSYAQWFTHLPSGPLSRSELDGFWGPNHEHPPLAKLLMGFSQLLLGGSPVMASRLLVAVVFGLLVEMVFSFGWRHFGGLAGAMAAASLVCMPRVFGHAHLAALDVPMAFFWFLAVASFARALERGSHRASALAGVCFGLALLTKINAVFLPLVLVGWGVWFHRRRAIAPLLWTLALGPAVFVAGWPWLWPDIPARLLAYLRPTWRVAIPVKYLGAIWDDRAAPWHYPLVMSAVTVPVGVLFLALLALMSALRSFLRDDRQAFLVANLAVTLGVFAMPGVPKYDGVRLFLPAFPFLALLAGIGGARCWDWVARRWRRRPWRPLLLSALFFLGQFAGIAWFHPYELSYYNALVGGLWGAEKLGFETTYWHEVVGPSLFRWIRRCASLDRRVARTLPWAVRSRLERRLASRPTRPFVVAFYPVGETVVLGPEPSGRPAPDLYEELYLNTPNPLGIEAVRLERAREFDLVVLNGREAMMRRHFPAAWRLFTRGRPLVAVRRQGVTLAAVFWGEEARKLLGR